MKKNFLTAVLALFITAGAFATKNPIKKVTIDADQSTVSWVGKKITGKHTGTLGFQEGYLEMNGDNITGGMFVVDMTSLQVTDLEAGKGKEKLEGHLNSDDFFGIANHPTATFEITETFNNGDSRYSVVGNLTIKGHTEVVKVSLVKNGNTATTTFMVDRTKFDIKYGSASFFDGLKDKAINDEFELTVNLVM
jgi:polyisoprenoid-binding protein YceI